MWLWVKPNDQFGQSLLRAVRWLVIAAGVLGVLTGAALVAAWAAVRAVLAPIVRW